MIMNKYDMIYESICDLYNRGILTEEEANEVNDLAYEKYSDILYEMKSKEEYGVRSFKKKYDFIPDKPGSNTGTINVNGKRQKASIDRGYTMISNGSKQQSYTAADLESEDGTVHLNKDFFKLKGSHGNERRDALLQHEIGHTRLHSIDKNSKTRDNDKATGKVHAELMKARLRKKGLSLNDSLFADRFVRKNLFDNAGKQKQYIQAIKGGSREQKNQRDKDMEYALKYGNKYNNDHLDFGEIEADRYAANKTSERALKKALNNTGNLNKKHTTARYTNKTFKKLGNDLTFDPSDMDYVKKYYNINLSTDLKQRYKALKDQNLRNAKSYKD